MLEAIHRLREPAAVLAGPMLAIAVLGLAVNVAAFLALHGAERDNLNVKGALLHVLGDLLGSAAAIVAALVILWTGWTPIDPLLSVLVALLILRSAWFLVRESGHILLEAAPRISTSRPCATICAASRACGHPPRARLVADPGPADGDLHARIAEAARGRRIGRIGHLRALRHRHATVESSASAQPTRRIRSTR